MGTQCFLIVVEQREEIGAAEFVIRLQLIHAHHNRRRPPVGIGIDAGLCGNRHAGFVGFFRRTGACA
jgi:hypothetical protein